MTPIDDLEHTFQWLEKAYIAGWLSDVEFCRFRNTLHTYLCIKGTVQAVSPAKSLIDVAAYQCKHCGRLTHIVQKGQFLLAPSKCGNCDEIGPFRLCTERSKYVPAQAILLQIDASFDLDCPCLLRCQLRADIIDSAAVGDQVVLKGQVRVIVPNHLECGKSTPFELELTVDTIDILSKTETAQ